MANSSAVLPVEIWIVCEQLGILRFVLTKIGKYPLVENASLSRAVTGEKQLAQDDFWPIHLAAQ